MNIYIIRHAKVKKEWPKVCNATELDAVCQEYDQADIVWPTPLEEPIQYEKVYVSRLPRSLWTAQGLFPGQELEQLRVEEVPIRSFMNWNVRLPLAVWSFFGRLQWYMNCSRQPELRRQTLARTEETIDLLENRQENCVIVTHGFYINTLIRCLKKRGYEIDGQDKYEIDNLQIVTAKK